MTLLITGRRMVFWGALALFAWAGYELSIRIEEMTIWLTPVFLLVRDGKLGLLDYFSRVPWHRLTTHLFLILCLLFALFAFVSRKRMIFNLLNVPVSLLLILFSLGSTPLMSVSLWQKLKLLPLVLIGLGGALAFTAELIRCRKKKEAPLQPQQHRLYDPFGMKRNDP